MVVDIVAGRNPCRADSPLFPEQLLLVSRYAREVLCVEITLNRAEIVIE